MIRIYSKRTTKPNHPQSTSLIKMVPYFYLSKFHNSIVDNTLQNLLKYKKPIQIFTPKNFIFYFGLKIAGCENI